MPVAAAIPPGTITGLVLAGGAGRRMGGADKGLCRFAGQTLAARAIARLAPQVDRVWISANRNLPAYRQLGVPVIGDALIGYPGPLAGWQSALVQLETRWLASVPCDAPFFPADLVARLAAAIGDAPAATACVGDALQPVFSLLHRDLLPALERSLASGERGVGRWLDSVGTRRVPFADAAAFVNVNDAGALERAESLAAASIRRPESGGATSA
jgi:molybdopterin-guanine dinucleotide biosynthesis protein A